jgi:hypothetical protein
LEKFKIHIPNKRYYLTINHIIYVPLFALGTILTVNQKIIKNENIESVTVTLLCINILIFMVFLVMCHFMQQKNRGTNLTHIEFHEDKIVNYNNEISLLNIEQIDFYIGPRLGQYAYGFHKTDLTPRLSNGNSSCIWITMKDKTTISNFIHLDSSEDFFKKMRKYLITYHLKGLIPFLRLIELLDIYDYQEIQEFKKQIYLNPV